MNSIKKKIVLLRRKILFFWLWPMAFNLFSKKPINEKLILFAYNQNYDNLPDNMEFLIFSKREVMTAA